MSEVPPTGLPATVPAAPGYKVDLAKTKTQWDARTLRKRVIWSCLVKPFFMILPQPANALRIALLRLCGATIGDRCLVAGKVDVLMPWKLFMGSYAAIGRGVEIQNFADVRIGEMTVVSQYTYLCTGTHDYTHPHFPLRFAPITIGSECWIAADVFVAPGVRIGDGAVVGARSVVTRDVPSWMVCAGNPCKPIKARVMKAL